MAFEFLGGDVHCGRPWSPWGVTVALVDCPDHRLTGGYGAVMEAFLSGRPSHDPVGWPTFKDWPAPDSLTHEGTYYKWMERSWRAGQRMLVNLLVENNQLCMLYPIKRNSCDDMTSIRLQAKDMHKMERLHRRPARRPRQGLVPHRHRPGAGPRGDQRRQDGRDHGHRDLGALRLPRPPRHPVLHARPRSTASSTRSRRWAWSRWSWSTSSTTPSPASPVTPARPATWSTPRNTLETGSPWRMQTCDPNDPEVHDKDQDNSAPIPSQDALFGAPAEGPSGSITNADPADPALPRQAPLQQARAQRPRRATRSRAWRSGT